MVRWPNAGTIAAVTETTMEGRRGEDGVAVAATPEAEGVGFERHEAVRPPRAEGTAVLYR